MDRWDAQCHASSVRERSGALTCVSHVWWLFPHLPTSTMQQPGPWGLPPVLPGSMSFPPATARFRHVQTIKMNIGLYMTQLDYKTSVPRCGMQLLRQSMESLECLMAAYLQAVLNAWFQHSMSAPAAAQVAAASRHHWLLIRTGARLDRIRAVEDWAAGQEGSSRASGMCGSRGASTTCTLLLASPPPSRGTCGGIRASRASLVPMMQHVVAGPWAKLQNTQQPGHLHACCTCCEDGCVLHGVCCMHNKTCGCRRGHCAHCLLPRLSHLKLMTCRLPIYAFHRGLEASCRCPHVDRRCMIDFHAQMTSKICMDAGIASDIKDVGRVEALVEEGGWKWCSHTRSLGHCIYALALVLDCGTCCTYEC
mmetsp:Transcript_31447/g.70027  ORF Transcript_31447/g.70027 Transcript_31447/m.70027 type:complete len:365 (-) Transcript_31447:287-1381(-)